MVDDHRVVREGTRRILEAGGIDVVGEAATAEEALELLERALPERMPEVLLADVRLPGMTGIELTSELSRRKSELKVVILSSYANASYASAALKAGAAGYLVKTATDDELVSAVKSAALGATVLDSAVSVELVSQPGPTDQLLTEREREVVECVIEGLANKAIATRLSVSRRTVDAHLSHVFTKLGISSRAELVAWAARHGMIER